MSADEIFHQALARPQAERPAFLAAACAGDAALQRRIEALLHAHENPGSFLSVQPPTDVNRDSSVTSDPFDAALAFAYGPNSAALPAVPRPSGFGRYEIGGELGQGGMGVVLRGRDNDLGRELAVKVLREYHRDEPALVRRFIEEAQIG